MRKQDQSKGVVSYDVKKKTIKILSKEIELESSMSYDYVAEILAELVLIKMHSNGNGFSEDGLKERDKDEKGSDLC